MSRRIHIKAIAVLAAAFLSAASSAALAAESIKLEAGADTPLVSAGGARRVIVRALLRPERTERMKRSPLAVALVIDKSGSMASDRKMENARLGALEAIRSLDDRDVAVVVVYDDEASVLLPPTNPTFDDEFRRKISKISPGGSTALYDGVKTGAAQLRPFTGEGYIPRIILLSDGIANVGPSSTRELASLGRTLSGQETTITTIGLGLDYNEDLMTALAAESGGNSYFARTAETLPDIFARDMKDALRLTARRTRVTLTCTDEATPIRVLGRSGERRGQTMETSIGNLYSSEKYALFEIEVPERGDGSLFHAATVRVEYVDSRTGMSISTETPVELAFTDDAMKAEKNRSTEIIAQTALARNAEIRDEVVRLSDEGRVKEASKLLKSRAPYMRKIASLAPSEAPEMNAEADSFDSLAQELEEAGEMSSEQRKKTVNDSYIQKNQQSDVNDVE
ncbi:MAG: VWA domain-containing protein [Synergistaceae bacterium]|jgi:Ca-activated chloride channel family protein|nr:VWA domain-containing protein [Synergistaceae bacterium]